MAAKDFYCVYLHFPIGQPTRFDRNFNRKTYVLRSSFPLGLMAKLCDKSGSRKIQDGGLLTSNACISAPWQDINEISPAIPMFLGSSIPLGLMEKLCDKTGSGEIQDGGLQTSNACISAPWQDINEIPTAIPIQSVTPMFSGSSYPMEPLVITNNVSPNLKKPGVENARWWTLNLKYMSALVRQMATTF